MIKPEDIINVYFNVGEDYSPDDLEKKVVAAYNEYNHIRMIFDLDKVNVANIKPMMKVKKVFERIGVEKLVETCVYSSERKKLMLVRIFLKTMKTERPVRFL